VFEAEAASVSTQCPIKMKACETNDSKSVNIIASTLGGDYRSALLVRLLQERRLQGSRVCSGSSNEETGPTSPTGTRNYVAGSAVEWSG
jgi:hypothetical protein